MNTHAYDRLIAEASHRYRIPTFILKGLIEVESGFNPRSVSGVGAFGLTQFMPGTARSYGVRAGTSRAAVRTQILGAAHLLSDTGFHSRPLYALAAYNGGAGNPQYGYAHTVVERSRKYRGQTKLIGAAGGSGGGAPRAGGRVVPGTTQLVERGQGASPTLSPSLLSGRSELTPQGGGGVAIPEPPFSARASLALPAGYAPITGGGGGGGHVQNPSGSDFQQALASAVKLRGPAATVQTTAPRVTGGGGGGGRPGGGGGVSGGQYRIGPGARLGRVVVGAGADRSGVHTKPHVVAYVRRVAALAGVRAITITTGTNHNRLTVDGNVSDHWSGNAADIGVPVDSKLGDRIAAAALMEAGVPRRRAIAMARHGGLYSLVDKSTGRRIQVIWKTYQGGNHHNHVHIGVR